MNRKYLVALGALVVAGAALAAPIDNTSSSYKPTNGSPGTVQGVVIQQSIDAYNSVPINSAHPLPVTIGGGGGVTANQGTPNTAANGWPTKITDGTDVATVTAAGEVNVLATAQPGVDIGDVTVNNAIGSPANVQIGDGTRTATVRDTGASDSINVAIVDASGNQITSFGGGTSSVQGVGAHDAPISGNPVRIGGRVWTSLPADLTEGDTADLPTNVKGVLTNAMANAGSDDVSNLSWGGPAGTYLNPHGWNVGGYLFDGVTWDRARGNSTGGAFVQGNIAHDSPATANPLMNGGFASNAAPTSVTDGDAVRAWFENNGAQVVTLRASGGSSSADGETNTTNALQGSSGNIIRIWNQPRVFNGTSWDRTRSAGVGNNVAATGIAADAPYGQYLNNANIPAVTTGNYGGLQMDPAGNLRTAPQRPTAGDILAGSTSVTATTASTALITVSAGRTWVGQGCISVSGSKAATATGNGEVLGTFLTAGTSVVPAAGTYFQVDTAVGANAATGTVGTNGANQACQQITMVAPAGNSVTLNYSATCTNTTACRVSASAWGVMQ